MSSFTLNPACLHVIIKAFCPNVFVSTCLYLSTVTCSVVQLKRLKYNEKYAITYNTYLYVPLTDLFVDGGFKHDGEEVKAEVSLGQVNIMGPGTFCKDWSLDYIFSNDWSLDYIFS